jgi:hypothetical protein
MDREFVLRWAHLGLARNPRCRDVIEKQRRIGKEHVEEIWAQREALDAARHRSDGPPLRVADGYAAGRPRRQVS